MRKRHITEDSVTNPQKIRFDFGNTDVWLPLLVESLIIIIAIFSLRETLKGLYSSDDLIYSLSRTGNFLGDITVDKLHYLLIRGLVYPTVPGRILIGQIPTHIPMLLFNLFQYRIYVLILICINIWLFGKCVYQWTGSYKIKWVSMLMTPLFFQIYSNYIHHPILNFYGLMQLLFISLFSSMFFFWKYCVERKKRWLIISGVFYLWGLVTYEVAFMFIPVFILLAYLATKDIKKTVLSSWLPITLFVILILINIFIAPNKSYGGTKVSLNIPEIARTTINQMSAAIPLSNFFGSNWAQTRSIIPKLFSFNSITLGDILTVILLLITIYLIYRTTEAKSKIDLNNLLILVVLGIMMLVLPSALMGLSTKYQNEVGFGRGHIPVYIQYFGLIILLIAVYILIKDGFKKFDTKEIGIRSVNILIVVTAIFILLTNQQYGRASINSNNRYYNPMIALQYSLQENILNGINDDAFIINTQVVTYRITSDSAYSSLFFSNYSQKPLNNVVYIDNYLNQIIEIYKAQGKLSGLVNFPMTTPTFIFRTNGDHQRGVIYMGKVKSMTIDLANRRISKCAIDELRIFVMNSVTAKYISLYQNDGGVSDNHKYYFLDNNLIKSGEKGQIYEFKFTESLVDFNSLMLVDGLDQINPNIYKVIGQPIIVDLDQPIYLGNNLKTSDIFDSGWSMQEDWGRWSEGSQSTLLLKIRSTPDRDIQITFSSIIFAPKENLSFSIVVNDTSLDHFLLPGGMQQFSIIVPHENSIDNNGELKIMFDIENPISPKQAGYSDDSRILGIGLISFIIETAK